MNFETLRDRLLGLLLPGILTYFVLTDFADDRTISNTIVFIAWIAVCAGATSAFLETWIGQRNGR